MEQYVDYIKSYHDRKEREAQLVNQYSQKPEFENKPLWLLDMEKQTNGHMQPKELLGVCIGLMIVAVIIALAIL